MITIKQQENKWKIQLENELWEVQDIEHLKILIEDICLLKEKYGRIKERRNE